jgi:hypothetical protein
MQGGRVYEDSPSVMKMQLRQRNRLAMSGSGSITLPSPLKRGDGFDALAAKLVHATPCIIASKSRCHVLTATAGQLRAARQHADDAARHSRVGQRHTQHQQLFLRQIITPHCAHPSTRTICAHIRRS